MTTLGRASGGGFRRAARRSAAAALFGLLALVAACEEDLAPPAETPIDGTWDVAGFFQFEVNNDVRCRFSGTLELEQLPGGVNTIRGQGSHAFDCEVADRMEEWTDSAGLVNSRLTGTSLSLTWGQCHMGADYEGGREDLLGSGIAICRMSFPEKGVIDVAGTWQATRQEAP